MRGHIRPHGDDAWRIHVYVGTDPITGKERQKTKVVRGTKKDAERELTKLLGEVDDGRVGPDGRTFGYVLDAWLDHKTLSVEATTADTYRHQLAYIPDKLRAMPVGRVDVELLEALYAHLRRKGNRRTGGGLSAKSVKNVHVAIHGALELARRRKWITVNPAVDAEVPTEPRREPSPAPAEKIGELFRAAADQHHALPTYLRLTLAAGARRSEVHGLRWSGVDFARGRITLRDVIVWAGGRWQVKPRTKTGGHRVVTVGSGTLAALEVLHDRAFTDALACGETLPKQAFVFTDDPVGEVPWRPATTARRFRRACEVAGLPDTTRLHDLRHLAATYLIDRGVSVPTVSARLGHSQPSTTLDVYTGRVEASDVIAGEVMEQLFGDDAG
jgi:integrase